MNETRFRGQLLPIMFADHCTQIVQIIRQMINYNQHSASSWIDRFLIGGRRKRQSYVKINEGEIETEVQLRGK